MTLRYENPREIEIQRAERRRCVGLVLELFGQQRAFPEIAALLDDLANRMEHPELAQLEAAAERLPHPND